MRSEPDLNYLQGVYIISEELMSMDMFKTPKMPIWYRVQQKKSITFIKKPYFDIAHSSYIRFQSGLLFLRFPEPIMLLKGHSVLELFLFGVFGLGYLDKLVLP
jgi:hypothetical protein